MSDKQHYVKVTFEWGVDEGGEFTAKNRGEAVWVSMPYADSVALQTQAIVPSFNDMFVKAADLGAQAVEVTNMPGNASAKPKL